jgi:hypothetical protein
MTGPQEEAPHWFLLHPPLPLLSLVFSSSPSVYTAFPPYPSVPKIPDKFKILSHHNSKPLPFSIYVP